MSLINFKKYAPLALICFGILAAIFSMLGEESYGRLLSLKKSLQAQKETNAELSDTVSHLRSRVSGLRNDNRELEKAARNEQGMARPNELIFVFEKKGENGAADSAKAVKK